MAWDTLYTNETVKSVEPHLIGQWASKLRAGGFDDAKLLHPFAFADLTEDLTKHRLLLAYQMGLGKTGTSIAGAAARGTNHVLFVVPRKLLAEWQSEFARLGLTDQTKLIESLSDIDGYDCPVCETPIGTFQKVLGPNDELLDVERRCQTCGGQARHINRLARFNLITMRQLWAVPKDSPHYGRTRTRKSGRTPLKHSFAHILRRRSELVIVDEAYTIANPDAVQTQALNLLKPRKRWLLTGTPIKGYPENILALLNWLLGNGTELFPDFDATQQGSRNQFIKLFGMKIEKVRDDGSTYFKRVPRINHPARFQAMLSPFMRRRVNLEPAVAAFVQMPPFIIAPEQVEPDLTFRDIYEGCVTDFAKWYAAAVAEEKRTARKTPWVSLLTRLNFLAQLAACPQATVAGYDGTTSKQRRVIELTRSAVARGRKVIIFSEWVDSLDWYAKQSLLAEFDPTVITGSVSMTRGKRSGTSERERRLDAFREGDSMVLLASTTCFAEGLNVPQAGTVIFDSFPWVPSVQNQAWSRVLRPAQKHRPVEIHLVGLAGTIDDYLSALCAIKRAAIGEGIDYEAVEMDFEELPDPRVYAGHLVEVSTAVAAAYDATNWIERLKSQAAASGVWR